MTIEYTATNRNDYTGNGINTIYNFTFKVLKQLNAAKNKNYTIKVIISENDVKTELTEDVDYTVALESNGFGTITFTTAPTSTQQIVFLNEILRTQEADYINIGSGKFPADSHEKALDKLTLICKEQDEAIGRAILLDETSNLSNITLPINTGNADKALVINSSGDNLAAKNLADIGLAPVTDFAKTLLDDTSNIEARTTLNVYSKSEVYNKSESDNLITEATTTTQGISYLDKPITIANNATDADHDMDFGAGNFDFDDGSGQATLSALTKQFDATFALGTNAGGMVSGESLPADGFVYVYQISNENGTITDIIGTTTADGSTISGDSVVSANSLTKKKYLCALPTGASSNIRNGNYTTFIGGYKFEFGIPVLNFQKTITSTTPTPENVTVPNKNNVTGFFSVYLASSTPTGSIRQLYVTSVAQSSTILPRAVANINFVGANSFNLICINSQVNVFMNVGNSNTSSLQTEGWEEKY
jgi:hypothetical protein